MPLPKAEPQATTPEIMSIPEARKRISQELWVSEERIREHRPLRIPEAGWLEIETGKNRGAIKVALLCDDTARIIPKGLAKAKEFLLPKMIRYMADRQVRGYRGKRVRTQLPKAC